jgi:hypothetical protein
MAKMPGRFAQPWCPYCRAPAGPDCPSRGRSPRQVRERLKAELRREVASEAIHAA